MNDLTTSGQPETARPARADAGARRYYWQRHTDGSGTWRGSSGPPGNELAALRQGTGREPGSVAAMWPYYTTLNPAGTLTRALCAEHLALTLFAIHQQSQQQPMHRDGEGIGSAVLALRVSEKFSPEAVDRRFAAAATASSIAEVGVHLRGLITQLRSIGQPLDYTRLLTDLRAWQDSGRIAAVRRRWGSQYFSAASHGNRQRDSPSAEVGSS